ncbi:helix-turn-helix transcriptional regulator [Salicibibacter cibarius]|uniref:Helix-turn-helix transcriptional regulator n=1 Tax=Salicibibacter cibarius TaxID=2743000 RepID=A0A7T7C9U3_9BACI|nr:helix-turn-helix transcriptional regulator [Salicibibacter cibarius]QQK74204.1 helix-turn-helix transcriptional regulator [Salicibibacter cibarius]
MIVCKLGDIMAERQLSNREVVEKTGNKVSRNTVKSLQMNASRRIDFETLYNLCVGLGVQPGDLLQIEEGEQQ